MTDQRATDQRATDQRATSRPGHSAQHSSPRRRAGLVWLRESAIIVGSALVLSLVVKTFLVQAFFIPTQSMHDTLVEGDRVLVNKLAPGPFELHRGDIVVFKDPGGWLAGGQPEVGAARRVVNDALTFVGLRPQDSGDHLIKRIIGLPGDHVASEGDGAPVTVNGVPLDEPYLADGVVPSADAFDQIVPADRLWVMGDNRPDSADSRYTLGTTGGGFLPVENVVGVAFVTVWPLGRMAVHNNPSDTFAAVPDAS